MSRHRNVRTLNYDEDYFDEDDVYGHSVEDNYCISPSTAAQFTFNRDKNVDLSNFLGEEGGIPEEEEDSDGTPRDHHRHSLDYTRPQLNDVDEARLNSCLEEVRNVLGESLPEHILVDTIVKQNFDLEKSLNQLLNQSDAPKPQREPRQRRNRSQEFDDDYLSTSDPSSVDENIFCDVLTSKGGLFKFSGCASPQSPLLMNCFRQNFNVLNKQQTNQEDRKTAAVTSKVSTQYHNFTMNQNLENIPPSEKSLETFDNNVCFDSFRLTELPIKHCSSPSKQAEPNASFSKLSNQSKPLLGEASPSLSDLAAQQKLKSNQTNLTCSTLISSNDSANRQTNMSLSKQAAQQTSLSYKSDISPAIIQPHLSLCELEAQHKSASATSSDSPANKQPGLSLSDLASKHKSTPSLSNSPANKQPGLSLSDLAGQHKSTPSLSNSPANKKPGLSLSDLAAQHKSAPSLSNSPANKQPGLSLSDLATQHKSAPSLSNSPANKQPGLSLSDLAAQHKSTPSLSNSPANKQPGLSLSDLAAQHKSAPSSSNSPANKQPGLSLSALAAQHKSAPSLSSPANKQPSLFPTNNPIGLPLSELVAQHGQSQPCIPGSLGNSSLQSLSLSSLGGKTVKVGSSDNTLINKQGLSLSDLAKAHGVNPEPIDKIHEQKQVLSRNQRSISGISLIKKPENGDRTHIIQSLSTLVEQHGKSQAARSGPPSYNVSPLQNSNRKMNFTPKLTVVQHSAQQEPKLSLADLARKKASIKTEVKNEDIMSTEVAPTHIPYNDTLKDDDKENIKMPENLASRNSDILEMGLLSSTEVEVAVKQFICGPSTVGRTLCISMHKPHKSSCPRYKMKMFRYSYQMRNVGSQRPTYLKEVTPFDFSTPSPDDTIKSKQKLAFTRSGERRERKVSD